MNQEQVVSFLKNEFSFSENEFESFQPIYHNKKMYLRGYIDLTCIYVLLDIIFFEIEIFSPIDNTGIKKSFQYNNFDHQELKDFVLGNVVLTYNYAKEIFCK